MRLFFYGVLIGRLASPRIRAMLAGLGPGRPAQIAGRLFAEREGGAYFPVLVPGPGIVRGMLHEAGSVDLAELDAFEFYYPGEPAASKFLRCPVTVSASGRSGIEAQAYLYNQPVTGRLARIAHGDFGRWLREAGRRPLAG